MVLEIVLVHPGTANFLAGSCQFLLRDKNIEGAFPVLVHEGGTGPVGRNCLKPSPSPSLNYGRGATACVYSLSPGYAGRCLPANVVYGQLGA